MDNFKLEIKQFDLIDKQIKEINTQIKPLQDKLKLLKGKKKELETTCCSYMNQNEIGECKLQDGALIFKETKNVVPLTKNAIKDNIIKFCQTEMKSDEFKKKSDTEKAEAIFSFIYENREYKDNMVLKKIE